MSQVIIYPIRAYKDTQGQWESMMSNNPNPFNLIKLKLQNKYQCPHTKTGQLKRKGEILS